MSFSFTRDETCALELDRQDELRDYRERFHISQTQSGAEAIYFCGNSLGLQPKATSAAVSQMLKEWERKGVEAWFDQEAAWLKRTESLAPLMADIVGAQTSEVTLMNSLTVNLHLMMVSFYRPSKKRYKILMEKHAFPSDYYSVKSQLRYHGYDPDEALILVEPQPGQHSVELEDIEQLIEREGDSISLILLGGINYYTGEFFDIERITQAGHRQGCVVGCDLAHAAGNLPLKLHDWQVDFAVWCNYKYLNFGPGSIGSCFVHERHHNNPDLPRFEGWWGNRLENRFLMKADFDPEIGARAWTMSTTPMLMLATASPALEMFKEVGMPRLRQKSLKLSAYLEFLLDDLDSAQFEIITPREPSRRGCQLSILTGSSGNEFYQALCKRGVVCDWREPNVIRLAPVPLYNSFTDVYRFIEVLRG